ncbi:hypothetical protein TELCIR_25725 [Teladorsagia circumcincta]|uniref:Uncharacterized protein n=1 Tax=Teladorsagia circumcincta TaxID=45464 RepID=A0A2G9T6F6_TELCI|nr:hypothetical protein TELCIR_25725 [Teladorsagia circumcincta]
MSVRLEDCYARALLPADIDLNCPSLVHFAAIGERLRLDTIAESDVLLGRYQTECCRSYEIHPCGHHGNEPYYGECRTMARTPMCKRRCRPGYKNSYMMDKRYGTC